MTTTTVRPDVRAPSHAMEPNASPAAVSSTPLLGTWKNIDPATRDLVRIVIAQSGSGITVHAFGACSPTPCDWGAVAGFDYSVSVTASPAVAFSAQYNFSFSKVILVGHLSKELLTVESLTHFTDGNGRNDFYAQMQMRK